ncbi:acyltransferase [Gilvimarinus agarilyticus]|uniref:acyltransferase n=1 Tax=Gilvimarinus agarilyticus TaxID=679259 RepID=UPI0005A1065F|nr:acyltransferase [Gilvimarinus agarilyticus]
MPDSADYQAQHKHRLSYMPWLYYRLKPRHLAWATPWQHEIQAQLRALETVEIGKNVFIAPEARLFAEPGRPIVIGDNSYIAADTVLHGPVTLGQHVSINHHASLDGGRAGIVIGDHCRIAAYCSLYAFNHGLAPDRLIRDQAVSSRGICIQSDVWLGSHTGVVDGVTMAEGAVAGMHSVVTRDVDAYQIVAGNPARAIGQRQNNK